MKKLLKSVAVAALAAAAAPSFAAISLNGDNSELVLMAWSPSLQASYVQDLGITISDFLAAGNAASGYSFSAAVTNKFSGLANATDVKWAVQGFYGGGGGDFAPGVMKLLTTVSAGSEASLTNTTGDNLDNGKNGYNSYLAGLNFSSTPNSTHFSQANGSSYATSADGAAYLFNATFGIGQNLAGNLQVAQGNSKGTASAFFYGTSSDEFDSTASITAAKFGNAQHTGAWNFDGSTVSYSLGAVAAPIPEPESYALMLAGLVAVAGLARRRSAR